MNWLLNRLREASTWRGLVWLLTVSGVALRPDQVEAIVLAGMALAGLIGVFVRDEIRSPETRTRETDTPKDVYIPQISLVGRSESTDSPCAPSTPDAGFDEFFDEYMARMHKPQLPSDNESQDPGSTLRQDGSGYNG